MTPAPALPRDLRSLLQWFGLNREHVELLLGDTQVDEVFREHCRESWENKSEHRWGGARECVWGWGGREFGGEVESGGVGVVGAGHRAVCLPPP